MCPGIRARQLTQWVLSAVLVVGISLVAWHSSSKNRTGWDDSPVGRGAMADSRSSLGEDEPSEQRRLEISSMPACVDLERSLQRLDVARGTLLKQAAAGSAETAIQALGDYQQAVQTVREGMERLRSRLTPDEYNGFWAKLTSERWDSRDAEFSLTEVQLGILSVRSMP
jgi:hypothetical protein